MTPDPPDDDEEPEAPAEPERRPPYVDGTDVTVDRHTRGPGGRR